MTAYGEKSEQRNRHLAKVFHDLHLMEAEGFFSFEKRQKKEKNNKEMRLKKENKNINDLITTNSLL